MSDFPLLCRRCSYCPSRADNRAHRCRLGVCRSTRWQIFGCFRQTSRNLITTGMFIAGAFAASVTPTPTFSPGFTVVPGTPSPPCSGYDCRVGVGVGVGVGVPVAIFLTALMMYLCCMRNKTAAKAPYTQGPTSAAAAPATFNQASTSADYYTYSDYTGTGTGDYSSYDI